MNNPSILRDKDRAHLQPAECVCYQRFCSRFSSVSTYSTESTPTHWPTSICLVACACACAFSKTAFCKIRKRLCYCFIIVQLIYTGSFNLERNRFRSHASVHPTLTFQIGVHIRLFIFRNIAALYGLIRVYTFIRFVSNPSYTIFIWSMFITLNMI